jgi:hypothetical protein
MPQGLIFGPGKLDILAIFLFLSCRNYPKKADCEVPHQER